MFQIRKQYYIYNSGSISKFIYNQKKLISSVIVQGNDEEEVSSKKVLSVVKKPTEATKKIVLQRNKALDIETVINFIIQDIKVNKDIEQRVKETHNDASIKERNRKVFGSILQHLGHAKKKLDNDDKVIHN